MPRKLFTPHTCPELQTNQATEFTMACEVEEQGNMLVFNTFSPGTPKQFVTRHPDMYRIKINVCPFCGKKLNVNNGN